MRHITVSVCVFISLALFAFPKGVSAMDERKVAGQTATLARPQREITIDTRAQRLKQFLLTVNSPMADSAEHFVSESDRLGLDWKLVAAIAGNESYFGRFIPQNSFNGWGWGVWTGRSYGIMFKDWNEGITAVSEGLKHSYVDRGLTSVEAIGRRYAADPRWAGKVRSFMDKIDTFEPYADVRLLALSL